MKEIPIRALAGIALFALSSPAQAGELFGGLYVHAVETPLSLGGEKERGIDVHLGYRGAPIIRGTKLAPYVFGAVNSRGDTSYAAAGLSWKFGDAIYVRPGLGVAIHSGSTEKFDQDDRLAFGSRFLINSELAVGTRVSSRMTVEASLVHLSHGQLFGGQNPGIDNIGLRLNLEL
ncbi:MAG: acyloxyacyl hydrolase [Pseudomonadota bacterium]|nr:acyloxyacyl hydrolase [Pseudomonadota bacterium]